MVVEDLTRNHINYNFQFDLVGIVMTMSLSRSSKQVGWIKPNGCYHAKSDSERCIYEDSVRDNFDATVFAMDSHQYTDLWGFFLMQVKTVSHLMVLPVFMRTHCGMGLFCLIFLASFIFTRKLLWAPWTTNKSSCQ